MSIASEQAIAKRNEKWAAEHAAKRNAEAAARPSTGGRSAAEVWIAEARIVPADEAEQ
jgi:hypothetical protein